MKEKRDSYVRLCNMQEPKCALLRVSANNLIRCHSWILLVLMLWFDVFQN